MKMDVLGVDIYLYRCMRLAKEQRIDEQKIQKKAARKAKQSPFTQKHALSLDEAIQTSLVTVS